MKRYISSQSWPKGVPNGVKRVVVPYEDGLDMLAARRQYATTHGYTLLAERQDGLVSLYWNERKSLVRLAVEVIE